MGSENKWFIQPRVTSPSAALPFLIKSGNKDQQTILQVGNRSEK